MLVVADSSPLIVLLNIGSVEILPALFKEVYIPPQVAQELRNPNRPEVVLNFIAGPPAWLMVRAPAAVEPIPNLHPGEQGAISLALELNADLLLIDEARGRSAAAERRIPVTGTVGILELAATRRLLHLAEAFERVKQTDFWISPELLDARLKLYAERHNA